MSWEIRAGRFGQLDRTWPYGGRINTAAFIAQIGHVEVIVTAALTDDREAVLARAHRLFVGAPPRMMASLRRLIICHAADRPLLPPTAPNPPAMCDLRGGIWHVLDGGDIADGLSTELFHHELAHCAGGMRGGPPDGAIDLWTGAQRADAATARGQLDLAGPVAVGGLLLGEMSVTSYGLEEGPVEDWADAVCLYLRERRLGAPLIPSGLADRVAPGRPGGESVRFADIWPARAAIIDAFILGNGALPGVP